MCSMCCRLLVHGKRKQEDTVTTAEANALRHAVINAAETASHTLVIAIDEQTIQQREGVC